MKSIVRVIVAVDIEVEWDEEMQMVQPITLVLNHLLPKIALIENGKPASGQLEPCAIVGKVIESVYILDNQHSDRDSDDGHEPRDWGPGASPRRPK